MKYPLLPPHAEASICIPYEDQAALRSALGRNHPHAIVAVFTDDGWHLETRDSRAQMLRRGGVYELARKISSAIVPRGQVLVLVDCEGATHVTTLPTATVFGEDEKPAQQPACLRAV